MATIDRPEVRASLSARLEQLTPTAERKWGKMTCAQMLEHVADSSERVRRGEPFTGPSGIGTWFIKLIALRTSLDWPHGLPSGGDPASVEVDEGRFDDDRARVIAGLEAMAASDGAGFSAAHPAFGKMSRMDWLRWAERHVDHHLKQFGA